MPEIPEDFETDVELLKTDYNRFLEIIKLAGLSMHAFQLPPLKFHFKGNNPAKFNWVYKRNANFYFSSSMDMHQYFYDINFFPAEIRGEQRWLKKELNADSPIGLIVYFKKWVEILSAEINAENYFDSIFNSNQIFESIPNNSKSLNIKFTTDELELLKNEMGDVKKMIFDIGFATADELQNINDKLDILIEFAQRETKSIWQDLFIGTTIKTILPILGKDTVKTIWDIIKYHFPASENLLK